MIKRLVFAAAASVVLSTSALAAIITGPANLPNSIGFSHSNTGLHITANQNSTLDSFVYWNQGPNETVFLRDDSNGTTLFSTFVVTNSLQQFVDVNWALHAGHTYRLMIDSSNGMYSLTGSPSSNADITVNVAFFSNYYNLTGHWSSFTDITTVSQVPEPGTLAMMGLALAGLALRKQRS